MSSIVFVCKRVFMIFNVVKIFFTVFFSLVILKNLRIQLTQENHFVEYIQGQIDFEGIVTWSFPGSNVSSILKIKNKKKLLHNLIAKKNNQTENSSLPLSLPTSLSLSLFLFLVSNLRYATKKSSK